MQVLNDKIGTARNGATNASPSLTISAVEVLSMANASLPFSNKSKQLCAIEGCPLRRAWRFLCTSHYRRFRDYGDPTASRPITSRLSPEQRFWRTVDKSSGLGPDGTCWEWTAALNQSGYGAANIRIDGKYKQVGAHRGAWYFTFGKMPELWLLHSCDNRRCVNIDHLREGTPAENVQDMIDRGRSYRLKQTHCKNGHPFTDKSRTPKGNRMCRDCKSAWNAEYRRAATEKKASLITIRARQMVPSTNGHKR